MLFAATVRTVQQSDHDKFMQPKQEYSIEELKRRVPEAYHSEIKVFSQVKVDKLPSHREKNHEINFIFENKSPFIKSYRSMSEQQLIAVKKYLDKHLEKKVIKSSLFKAVALMFFVKKFSGGLKFCVDYRKLNKIIKKNRYSFH